MHLQVKGSELDSLIAIEIANLLEQVRVREEKGNRDVDGEKERGMEGGRDGGPDLAVPRETAGKSAFRV